MTEPGPPPSIQGMRVLLGPGDTASFATRLARALADQGAQCWVVDLARHKYSASPDKLGKAQLWSPRLTTLVTGLSNAGKPAPAIGSLLKTIGQLLAFAWSLVRVDAYVLVSSRSLLPGYLDLPIYKLLGKRVIRIFLGTDSRPRYMTGWHLDAVDPGKQQDACAKLAERVRRQRGRVRKMSRYADVVVDNPLCGHYQSKPYINWFHVGFPHDPAFYAGATSETTAHQPLNRPVRVLHSPSNPKVKGTEQIESVIEKLKAQGHPIEYTRITGMPREEVIRHLKQCDLVIDQLYSDSPMAGFASEAAAFGKPVIVGGYGWEQLQSRLGEDMPANLLCLPNELEADLESLLQDITGQDIGKQAYDFLNGYWHHKSVASRFAALLTGNAIDDRWWVDPATIDYWQGLGATDEHRMDVIKALVQQQGIDALGLEPGQTVRQTIRSMTEGV